MNSRKRSRPCEDDEEFYQRFSSCPRSRSLLQYVRDHRSSLTVRQVVMMFGWHQIHGIEDLIDEIFQHGPLQLDANAPSSPISNDTLFSVGMCYDIPQEYLLPMMDQPTFNPYRQVGRSNRTLLMTAFNFDKHLIAEKLIQLAPSLLNKKIYIEGHERNNITYCLQTWSPNTYPLLRKYYSLEYLVQQIYAQKKPYPVDRSMYKMLMPDLLQYFTNFPTDLVKHIMGFVPQH